MSQFKFRFRFRIPLDTPIQNVKVLNTDYFETLLIKDFYLKEFDLNLFETFVKEDDLNEFFYEYEQFKTRTLLRRKNYCGDGSLSFILLEDYFFNFEAGLSESNKEILKLQKLRCEVQ